MISTRLSPLLAACTASALLAACAVGPKSPDASLPPLASGAFVSSPLGTANGATTSTEARNDWWRLYADPTLDGLIEQAFARNNQLEAAVANLRAVRASLSEARSGRLPTTSASVSATRGQSSTATVQGLPAGQDAPEIDLYDVGLDASYEIDLFGRVASTIRAARADADAQAAALDIIRVSVAAETTRAYADACSANAQIAVAERTLGLQQDTADLTRRLLEGGAGTALDTSRAQAQLASTRARLPSLRAQRDGAIFRLATLTGVTPAEASTAARTCQRPPRLTRPIPVGDGSALLARRPDIRQAERNLAAAAARVNVATASLFPTISLGGSIGSTALDASDLSDDSSYRFSFGPLIRWSFPNVLTARARIEAADARTEAALATFDQTVLSALEETETALTNYANELDRRAALTEARDQAANASRLARLRFDAGADSLFTVLDAQRTEAEADAALAQSDALVTTYQIALFKALAGGWSQDAG